MAVRAGQDSLNGYFGVQFLMYGVPSAACVRIGPSTDEGVAIWTDRIRTVAMFGTRAGLGIDFGFAGTGYVLSDMVTACTMAALDGTVVMGFRAQLF